MDINNVQIPIWSLLLNLSTIILLSYVRVINEISAEYYRNAHVLNAHVVQWHAMSSIQVKATPKSYSNILYGVDILLINGVQYMSILKFLHIILACMTIFSRWQ